MNIKGKCKLFANKEALTCQISSSKLKTKYKIGSPIFQKGVND